MRVCSSRIGTNHPVESWQREFLRLLPLVWRLERCVQGHWPAGVLSTRETRPSQRGAMPLVGIPWSWDRWKASIRSPTLFLAQSDSGKRKALCCLTLTSHSEDSWSSHSVCHEITVSWWSHGSCDSVCFWTSWLPCGSCESPSEVKVFSKGEMIQGKPDEEFQKTFGLVGSWMSQR